ncbi:uncharacterized protein LOC117341588 [Pecten maximus]|uniref:uncharacterized protein LOC117341588 n=1 Tax=Pecten maximus TaxID=6579 RepID=UPI001458C78E|nr:uncharacterized protein LOC117341588 [Pecten maximus]
MAAAPGTLSEISMLNFEHIKYGEPCPLNDHVITRMMRDFRLQVEQKDISSLLAQCLDDCHGTEAIVSNRRKAIATSDYIQNANNNLLNWLTGGSVGDGFRMKTSDSDAMHVMMSVVVVDPDQTHLIPQEGIRKTILYMKEGGCRPGYVTLEIARLADGSGTTTIFNDAIIPFGDSMYLSSDIYRQGKADALARAIGVGYVSNGPCSTVYSKHYGNSIDISDAFPCISWPNAAHEWIHRPRLYGWPAQTMIDKIIQGGCHVVPVGDKCSTDTLLQWRISFACAEQMLVHSLTHPQFRVYGLLKYFLLQIKDLLDHIIGDRDVICSYFLKTLIFHAVENSPHSLWSTQNTFICFRFCLSILTSWVKSGYCPNYFIQSNNMFLRKIHGETRQRLVHLLKDMYNMSWMCLCLKSDRSPYIGRMLQQHKGATFRQPPEYIRDLDLFRECLFSSHRQRNGNGKLYSSMQCLHTSHTDADDFIAYFAITTTLTSRASELFGESNTGSNKQKYISMKKCKHFLTPQALMCTSPGLMMLATFHYLTADYRKTLQMCAYMRSTGKLLHWQVNTSD